MSPNDGNLVVVTRDVMMQGASSRGGYSRKQIAALGENQRIQGWYGRLIGKEVPREAVERFLRMKDAHLGAGRVANAKTCKHLLKEWFFEHLNDPAINERERKLMDSTFTLLGKQFLFGEAGNGNRETPT